MGPSLSLGRLSRKGLLKNLHVFCVYCCNPSRHLQESPGPQGPKSQQKSQKGFLGGSAEKSPKNTRKKPKKYPKFLTCFHTSFFPFCLFTGHLFTLFSHSSKSALFCRAKGTAQSLERGSFSIDLSTKLGKEMPSRNPREKGSEIPII